MTGLDHIERKRSKSYTRIFGFLQLSENLIHLKSEKSKREFIASLDTLKFIKLLTDFNAELTLKNKKDRKLSPLQMTVGSGLTGRVYSSPHPGDFVELYEKTLKVLQKMNSENTPLTEMAIFLSASINAVHGFHDGNGRLSRLLYFMLAGTDVEMFDLQKILSERGRDYFDFSPMPVEEEVLNKQVDESKILLSPIRVDIPELEKLRQIAEAENNFAVLYLIDAIKDNDNMLPAAISIYILELDPEKLDDYYVEKKFGSQIFKKIKLTKILEDIKNPENLERLASSFRKVKKQFVLDFLGIFENPVSLSIEDMGQSLREVFFEKSLQDIERKKKERAKKIAEEEAREEAKRQELAILENVLKVIDEGEEDKKKTPRQEVSELFELKAEAVFFYETGKESSKLTDAELLRKYLRIVLPKIEFSIQNLEDKISEDQSLANLLRMNRKKIIGLMSTLEYLSKIGYFKTMLSTTSNIELAYLNPLKALKEIMFLSVYFVTKNGSTLRLRLFDIFNKDNVGEQDFIQDPMEKIFFVTTLGPNILKQSVLDLKQVDTDEPTIGKKVFEVSSIGFEDGGNLEFTEGVRTVEESGRVFVGLKDVKSTHEGYYVYNIVDL